MCVRYRQGRDPDNPETLAGRIRFRNGNGGGIPGLYVNMSNSVK